jgi:hypothetical protein
MISASLLSDALHQHLRHHYAPKQTPKPSLTLVAHSEQDSSYVHFDVSFVGHPSQPAVTGLPFDVTPAGTFSFVNAWWLAESALLSYWDAGAAHERFLDRVGLASELIEDGGRSPSSHSETSNQRTVGRLPIARYRPICARTNDLSTGIPDWLCAIPQSVGNRSTLFSRR